MTEINTIKEITDKIKDELTTYFDTRINSVIVDNPFQTEITTPSIIIRVESMSEGQDDGTERTPIKLELEAHCILSESTLEVETEILDFCREIFIFIRENTWGLACKMPEDFDMKPEFFTENKKGYLVWNINWEQTFYLGESVWNEDGYITPDTLFISGGDDYGNVGFANSEYTNETP